VGEVILTKAFFWKPVREKGMKRLLFGYVVRDVALLCCSFFNFCYDAERGRGKFAVCDEAEKRRRKVVGGEGFKYDGVCGLVGVFFWGKKRGFSLGMADEVRS
jgi:hypothetical protein